MVFQLVYSSSATQEFWPDDIFALVEKSRSKNAPRGLTGMLLFHEGRFLQLLEGPEEAVRECFQMVQRDPRHETVAILHTGFSEARDFPEWTMGFEQPGDAWNLPSEWSSIMENGFKGDAAAEDPSAIKDLLLSFRLDRCA